MIARIWQGTVLKKDSTSYQEYLMKTGLKDYYMNAGNITAFLFSRDEGDVTHFFLLSIWEDLKAIKEFAGDEYERARYYPEDEKFLLRRSQTVKHYEVLNI